MVALKICEHFRDGVQATAYTGKAASLFHGPTIHSIRAWVKFCIECYRVHFLYVVSDVSETLKDLAAMW